MTSAIKTAPVVEPVLNHCGVCPQCGYEFKADWRITLTNRERQVLALVAQGYSNKMVAKELGLVPTTVKNHMTSVLSKTGSRDRTAAVMTALAEGWIRTMD